MLDLFGGSSGRVGALREGEAKFWTLRSLRDYFAVNKELPSKVVKLTREVAVVISRLGHNVLDAVATLEDGSGQTAQANTWTTSLETHEATITGLAVHVAPALANLTTAARHFGHSLLELAEQARDADAGLASIPGELQRLWSQHEAARGPLRQPGPGGRRGGLGLQSIDNVSTMLMNNDDLEELACICEDIPPPDSSPDEDYHVDESLRQECTELARPAGDVASVQHVVVYSLAVGARPGGLFNGLYWQVREAQDRISVSFWDVYREFDHWERNALLRRGLGMSPHAHSFGPETDSESRGGIADWMIGKLEWLLERRGGSGDGGEPSWTWVGAEDQKDDDDMFANPLCTRLPDSDGCVSQDEFGAWTDE